jgi:hypothetical protein
MSKEISLRLGFLNRIMPRAASKGTTLMRLSAPTNKTFFLALTLLVIGIVPWITPVGEDVTPDVALPAGQRATHNCH